MTTERDADFDGWYVQAYPRVRAAVTLAVGDADLAEEATAEAFARALVHWSKVKDATSSHAWVYTVAMNQVRSTLRRRGVERRWLRRHANEPVVHQRPPVEPAVPGLDAPSPYALPASVALPPLIDVIKNQPWLKPVPPVMEITRPASEG